MVCIGTGLCFPGNRSTGAPKSVTRWHVLIGELATARSCSHLSNLALNKCNAIAFMPFAARENIASWRVMENGHVVLKAMRGCVQVDNQPQDLRVYAILRDEG